MLCSKCLKRTSFRPHLEGISTFANLLPLQSKSTWERQNMYTKYIKYEECEGGNLNILSCTGSCCQGEHATEHKSIGGDNDKNTTMLR